MLQVYKVSKQTFIYAVTNIMIWGILLFNKSIDMISYLAFFQIVLSIIVICFNKGRKLLVGVIFLLFTFLFNFGQSMITIFGFDDIYAYKNVLNLVGEEYFIKAELFAMLCIFSFTLGYISRKNSKIITNRISEDLELHELVMQRINRVAWLIFAISFIPMFYVDIQKILAYLLTGYDSTYLVYADGIGKYFNLFGQFCKPAMCLLVYTNHDKKKLAKAITIVFSLYCVVMMLSGDRGGNIIIVITLFFVYYKFVEKIRFRTVVLMSIIAYFTLSLITIIGLTRSGSLSVKSIQSAYEWRSRDGVLYSVLREFGGSLISLCHSMRYTKTFNCGLTYVASFITVLPKYPDFIADIFLKSFTYTVSFPKDAASYSILGGSYLGELYYNFGWLSFIPAIVIGRLISKMDDRLEHDVSPYKTAVLIVLLPSLILWVRDFFSVMLFTVFWMVIILKYIRLEIRR